MADTLTLIHVDGVDRKPTKAEVAAFEKAIAEIKAEQQPEA
jgi:hypothetical protein